MNKSQWKVLIKIATQRCVCVCCDGRKRFLPFGLHFWCVEKIFLADYFINVYKINPATFLYFFFISTWSMLGYMSVSKPSRSRSFTQKHYLCHQPERDMSAHIHVNKQKFMVWAFKSHTLLLNSSGRRSTLTHSCPAPYVCVCNSSVCNWPTLPTNHRVFFANTAFAWMK